MCVKKICIILIFLSLTFNAFSQVRPPGETEEERTGYILLDDLIVTFENFDPYRPVEEWKSNVFKSLGSMLDNAKIARKQKRIDVQFFERYKRILYVLEMALRMNESQGKGVLVNIIKEQIKHFDIQKDLLEKLEINLIGSIAGAVAEEILSLKKYLDWTYALFVPDFARPKIIKKVKIKLPSRKVVSQSSRTIPGSIDVHEDPGYGETLTVKEPARFKKGRVLLEVVIDKKGNVIHTRLISSQHPQLNNSILEAVRQFKFNPHLKKKKPVSARFKLTLYCYL